MIGRKKAAPTKAKAPAANRWGQRTAAEKGYRSGLEDKVAAELAAAGVAVQYEAITLHYAVPARIARYTPDWVLPNGIVVETKGRFVTEDRKKHKLIREQYPEVDVRLVFSNPKSKIGKKSSTTYAMWCDRLGIPYAAKSIPAEWLAEPPCPARLAAVAKLSKKA